MKIEHFYITKIIAYISIIPYFIIFIFTIRSFNSSNIIHILNLQLIIATIANTSTYYFPFYDDNKSISCKIQSLLCFSTMFITSFIVMFITYLNIKLFTNTAKYEAKKGRLYIFNIMCWLFPISLSIGLYFKGSIKQDKFNYCYFDDDFTINFSALANIIVFVVNIYLFIKLRREVKEYLWKNNKEQEYKEYSRQFRKFNVFIIYVASTFILDWHDTVMFYQKKELNWVSISRNIIECSMFPIICGIFCINQSNIKDINKILCCKKKEAINEELNVLFDPGSINTSLSSSILQS